MTTEATTHAAAEFLPLFGGHLRPFFFHAAAPVHAAAGASAESAEEDLAKHQQSDGLPEGDRMPAKQSRRETNSKTFHDETKDRDGDNRDQHDFDNFLDH